MATITMIDAMNQYIRKRGWQWGRCDCIGLMFHLVSLECNQQFVRGNYVPHGFGYDETIDWLIRSHNNPMVPYLHFLDNDAQLEQTSFDKANLMILYDGHHIDTSTNEIYPIDKVPGIAFQPPHYQPLVFGRHGLVHADIYPAHIKNVVCYQFKNLR